MERIKPDKPKKHWSRPGGARPGAGRPKGSHNKWSLRLREEKARSGLLPHEFLLKVMRGHPFGKYKPTFEERIEAAKAAAPYFAPRLKAVEVSGQIMNMRVFQLNPEDLEGLSMDELTVVQKLLERQHRRFLTYQQNPEQKVIDLEPHSVKQMNGNSSEYVDEDDEFEKNLGDYIDED